MRERLKNLSLKDRQEKSLSISNFLKVSNLLPSEFGVYSPLELEVDWTLAFSDELFLFAGFVSSNEIAFYPSKLSDLKEFVVKKQTFKIPAVTQVVVPKVLLIPGLAMSKKGERLGRGGGYYDRYLEHFTGLKIGLTFDCCLVESLPSESHDQPMDWVVTESGIVKIRRQEWPWK